MNAKRSASLPSAFESARGDLICQDASRVAQEIRAAIKRTIPPAIRYRWLDKLFEVRANGPTLLEFLQEPPGSLRTKDIMRESEKVGALLGMKIAAMPDFPGTRGRARYRGCREVERMWGRSNPSRRCSN